MRLGEGRIRMVRERGGREENARRAILIPF